MDYQTLTIESEEGVSVITLNRPAKLNAWNYQMHAELHSAVAAANLNDDIGAIIVTAKGRGFCAGADMSYVFGLSEEEKEAARATAKTHEWIHLIRHSKPVIAAVNGAAIGIGVTLILPMDQIIAAADAKFGLSFVRMGLVPELGGSGLVQRRIGFGAASRLLLTGEHLSALEALEINLVDQVVPPEALLDESKQLARRMSLNPRSAILAIKALLTENANETDLDKVQRREAAALTECYSSPEHKEAVAAFKEKRVPNFKLARQ